jgi:hypothetical protein
MALFVRYGRDRDDDERRGAALERLRRRLLSVRVDSGDSCAT